MLLLLTDNARPHHSKITQLKLEEPKIDRIPHPPYFPDISPCDFHAFRSSEMFCQERQFKMWKDLQDALADYMGSRTERFWSGGFEKLPERWTQIVRSQGKYFDERQNA